ncbi:hypothetical protein FJZ28_04755 [Candidatus Peregrinibacteria bacterium]|nr:hypothetical protein [Candidatus Peregrinibacteria bacterium]
MEAFASLGASTLSAAIIAVNIISVVTMAAVVGEFLHIQHKRINLLRSLNSNRAEAEHKHGRALMWLYIISTAVLTVTAVFLYFIRP